MLAIALVVQLFVTHDEGCISETWDNRGTCVSCYELVLVARDTDMSPLDQLYDCQTRR